MWDYFMFVMVIEVSVLFDVSGCIVDWNYVLWSSLYNEWIVNVGWLLFVCMLELLFVFVLLMLMLQLEGGGDCNVILLYMLLNQYIVNNFLLMMLLQMFVMCLFGVYINVWVIESFMDEFVCVVGVDLVEFWLCYMEDYCVWQVIQFVVKYFGWLWLLCVCNCGVGFVFGKYKNLMVYVVIVVEVMVVLEIGQVMFEYVEVVVDVGQIVLLDGICNQIEGGIVQVVSWMLYEVLKYDMEWICSFDWSSYLILCFLVVLQNVKVYLVNCFGVLFLGVVEVLMGLIVGVLVNVIFDVIGQCMCEMLFVGDVLRKCIDVQ